MSQLQCERCDAEFRIPESHTEIVRRDFIEEPKPSKIEHLCGNCRREYVEEFLGHDGTA